MITPDGKTLIIGESMGRRLTAFTIAAPGLLTERRVFAEFPEGRLPDGICLDNAGECGPRLLRGTSACALKPGAR